MARVRGPDFVALGVRDLEVSGRFYGEKLGLERMPQSPPDAVVVSTEPIAFAVREPLVDLGAVEKLGWGVALWLGCDDAQALHDSLVEAGVQVAQEPFGRTFASVDSDGYRMTVHDGG